MQAIQIAAGLVQTHQPVDAGDLGECLFAGARRACRVQAFDAQLDQRAEPRLHVPECRAVHPAAPRNATSYTFNSRCTPSVTCRHDSVAPEMFLMSLFSSTGSPAVLPTNCLRQPARRISPPCDS